MSYSSLGCNNDLILANDADLMLVEDDDATVQAIVLAAAINGNLRIRSELPALLPAFKGPYRSVAEVLHNHILEGRYIDRYTFPLALQDMCFSQPKPFGGFNVLSPEAVMGLIFTVEPSSEQAEAYLPLLQGRLESQRQTELKDNALALVDLYGRQPDKLLSELGRLATYAQRCGLSAAREYPPELLEFVPYMAELVRQQQGNEFLGLNSGFSHFNNLCNGLGVGLAVIAAPPGGGKTTWVWQVANQVAELNRVPVIFVSLEQSKNELRAKALARLSQLHYRHILRGRLRSNDPQEMQRLLEAASQYAMISRYLTIVEGDDRTTVDVIADIAAKKKAEANAAQCLVLVDYLQILPLKKDDGPRVSNTKDRIDLHVSALRRLARQLNSPVLAISSENRAGYAKSKGLDVFKESGGIEYSADIAMVLSPDRSDSEPNSNPQSMLLNIIKNRNGERGAVRFLFYPEHAKFVETGKADLQDGAE